MFFICVGRNEEAVFWITCINLGITCINATAIWLLRQLLKNWIWKTRLYYFLYKPAEKGKNLPIWKFHETMTKKDTYICNDMQLQNHSLTFNHKNKAVLSTTSIPCGSPIAHNTTASLEKLTCTDYLDFGKCQDRYGQFFWSKNDSNYLDVKLKVFKKGDNKEFQLVQNPTMGEADFSQFMNFRNQLVNAAEKFAKEESLTPVLIPTTSKDMDEQLNLTHKVIDVVDRANRKICVTLRCTMWTSLRVLMLKSDNLQGKRRTRSFNKLWMWNKHLKNSSIYLM